MSNNHEVIYHETAHSLDIVMPDSEWLAESAIMVLELIQSRLETAPTDADRRILDKAAERFFLSMGM